MLAALIDNLKVCFYSAARAFGGVIERELRCTFLHTRRA
jgi:hypothetical protein